MKNYMTIYHGSKNIIENPVFGEGKMYNDYGLGFYCTEDRDLAKEWAVSSEASGFCNQYKLNMRDLFVLNLCDKEYTILHWLAILLENRIFDIQSDFGDEAKKYILTYFLPDYNSYDVIIGYRADDSYFSFAQDFLNNAISLSTLSRAMYLGELGQQVVLKSKKTFEQLEFVSSEKAEQKIWYPQKENRDRKARQDYVNIRSNGWKRGETYMMQVIDEEIKPDDPRIRPNLTK